MQGPKNLKYLSLLIFLLFLNNLHASALNSLHQADSLFNNGRFAEAYKIYNTLFEQGVYSEAMLMRITFAANKLNKPAEAAFYKTIAYRISPSLELGQDIMKYAENNKFTGYYYSELDILLSYFSMYRKELTIFMAAICLLFLLVMIIRRLKGAHLAYYPVFFLVFLGATLLVTNLKFTNAKAIISSNEALAYSGPSSGAGVVGVLPLGHQLNVSDTVDIWAQVIWKDKAVWVKKHQAFLLH
jgi:hypothetical protein